jgi:hypothetical protein
MDPASLLAATGSQWGSFYPHAAGGLPLAQPGCGRGTSQHQTGVHAIERDDKLQKRKQVRN